MKGLLFLCLFTVATVEIVDAQFIKLDGKHFVDENGNNFFPLIMNYVVDLAYDPTAPGIPPDNLNNTFLAQYIEFGSSGCYNYAKVADGPLRFKQDCYEMKNMGFNVVRLGLPRGKTQGVPGFFLIINNFEKCASDYDTVHLLIYPPYTPETNPRLKFLFDKILELNNLAENVGLKFWFGCSNGMEDMMGQPAIDDYRDFLIALAKFIHEKELHNFFCYELMGEPSYFEIYKKTELSPYLHSKSEICEISNEWNNALKENDPDHLTTIGCIGLDDPKSWDPNILNVDFSNIHVYLDPKTFEWPHQEDPPQNWLEKSFKRLKDKIYIWDHHLIKPYVISETSFPALNPGQDSSNFNHCIPYPKGSYGDENDGSFFVETLYPLVKNSGASGFGWWVFQDIGWYGMPPSCKNTLIEYCEDVYGIEKYDDPDPNDIENGYENANKHLRKEAGWTFVDYKNNPPGYQIPEYGPNSSSYDHDDQYYNPYSYPRNNIVYNNKFGTVYGWVFDKNNQPIQGAIVEGLTYIGNDPDLYRDDTTTREISSYYTYTDITGFFSISVFDYLPSSDGHIDNKLDNVVEILQISAYGSEWTKKGIWGDGPIVQGQSYCLKSLQSSTDKVVVQQHITAGQNLQFEGYSTITAYEDYIEPGGAATFSAINLITLQPTFYSKSGSELHVYCQPVTIDCDELTGFGPDWFYQQKKSVLCEENTKSDEVMINFISENYKNQVTLFPNPCKGIFTVKLTGDNINENYYNDFEVIDCLGNEMFHIQFKGSKQMIDIGTINPGIYFTILRNESATYKNKLIIYK